MVQKNRDKIESDPQAALAWASWVAIADESYGTTLIQYTIFLKMPIFWVLPLAWSSWVAIAHESCGTTPLPRGNIWTCGLLGNDAFESCELLRWDSNTQNLCVFYIMMPIHRAGILHRCTHTDKHIRYTVERTTEWSVATWSTGLSQCLMPRRLQLPQTTVKLSMRGHVSSSSSTTTSSWLSMSSFT